MAPQDPRGGSSSWVGAVMGVILGERGRDASQGLRPSARHGDKNIWSSDKNGADDDGGKRRS